MSKVEQNDERTVNRTAGLNCEKHRLSLGSATEDLLNLGIKYLGNGNWKLPPGARITYLGYDKKDDSEDWVVAVDGVKYHVWSAEG